MTLNRRKLSLKVVLLSIAVNLFLFLIKLLLGIASRSLSMVSDAVHSLSDAFSSALLLLGLRIATSEPDSKHPFGKERLEQVLAIILGSMLFFVAFEIGKESIHRFSSPPSLKLNWLTIILFAITVFIKEGLAIISFKVGDKISSPALKADALHHRADALSTIAVVAGSIASLYGVRWADPAVSMLIAAFLCYLAVKVILESSHLIVGTQPPREVITKIIDSFQDIPEIKGVHDIIVHQYGSRIIVSLHIEVDSSLSASRGHEVAEEFEEKLLSQHGIHATVHVDPIDLQDPQRKELEGFLKTNLESSPLIHSIHDMRIVGCCNEKTLIFDVVPREAGGNEEIEKLIKKVEKKLKKTYPDLRKIKYKIEAPFVAKI